MGGSSSAGRPSRSPTRRESSSVSGRKHGLALKVVEWTPEQVTAAYRYARSQGAAPAGPPHTGRRTVQATIQQRRAEQPPPRGGSPGNRTRRPAVTRPAGSSVRGLLLVDTVKRERYRFNQPYMDVESDSEEAQKSDLCRFTLGYHGQSPANLKTCPEITIGRFLLGGLHAATTITDDKPLWH